MTGSRQCIFFWYICRYLPLATLQEFDAEFCLSVEIKGHDVKSLPGPFRKSWHPYGIWTRACCHWEKPVDWAQFGRLIDFEWCPENSKSELWNTNGWPPVTPGECSLRCYLTTAQLPPSNLATCCMVLSFANFQVLSSWQGTWLFSDSSS